MKVLELDNISSLLVSMKKNCELKMSIKDLFVNDNTLPIDVKSYCDIMQNNAQWIDNYNLNLYKNFSSAIEKYSTQIDNIIKSINSIDLILFESYQSNIVKLFSNDNNNNINNDSLLVSLMSIDSFIKKIGMM